MDQFEGKVAVITGAGGGIGLATGRMLARRGARVVLADVHPERLASATARCRDEGLDVVGIPTDVSDFAAMQRLADTAFALTGAVHVLHLNAGIGGGASFFDGDAASWEHTVGVNLMGVVWGIKAFVPRMVDGGDEGIVLATSSGAGTDGTSYNQPAYAATKIAVLSTMECLYGQLRDKRSRVRAGVVFPPLTATNLAGNPEVMKSVEAMLQAGGVPATLVEPEAVAEMIVDGIERGRFFIRPGRTENAKIYGGAMSESYFVWNERVVRGRTEAQLSNGTPDAYLW